ncbi:DUF2268 domain-containing putative Zn-dependent protease [Limibacter armeniacum]|uniref:DUF2268 domain-containing putative Zn-dependent protease n=1 Tax=Limibacter armeniacum TaxID=466084 RepID=UPI002FE54D94
MKYTLLLSLLLVCSTLLGQSKFTTDPDAAQLVTSDIDNFWKAFNLLGGGYPRNPFGDKYLEIGSQGLKDFIPHRIQHADTLLQRVRDNKEKYLGLRDNTYRIKETEKQIRSTFYAFKYWYPEAQFPPVYFVIGVFNSGGTATENGLIIGAEMQSRIEDVPYIVAHELIHFQQKYDNENPTLLEQAIKEGSADFLGELISGKHINQTAFAYGEAHKEALEKEFQEKMNGMDYNGWLYGGYEKDDRPNDLGYWVGYQITKAYFDKQPDKHKAVKDILNISDYESFLKASKHFDQK